MNLLYDVRIDVLTNPHTGWISVHRPSGLTTHRMRYWLFDTLEEAEAFASERGETCHIEHRCWSPSFIHGAGITDMRKGGY